WSETLKPAPPGPVLLVPPWRSRDGRLLVLAADDKNSQFSIRDAVNGHELGKLAGPAPLAGAFLPASSLRAVAAAPGGSGFALAESSGLVRVWSTGQPKTVTTFQTDMTTIGSLAFSPKGDTLAVGGTAMEGKAIPRGLIQFWGRAQGAAQFAKLGSTVLH